MRGQKPLKIIIIISRLSVFRQNSEMQIAVSVFRTYRLGLVKSSGMKTLDGLSSETATGKEAGFQLKSLMPVISSRCEGRQFLPLACHSRRTREEAGDAAPREPGSP